MDKDDDTKRAEEYPYDPTTDREVAILAEGILKKYDSVFNAVAGQQQMNPGMVDALRTIAGDGNDESRIWSHNNYLFGMTSDDVRSQLAKKIFERVNDLAEQLQAFRDRKMGLVFDGSESDDGSEGDDGDEEDDDNDDDDGGAGTRT